MVCVCDLSLSGAKCPTPLQNVPEKGHFRVLLSPMNATCCRQFDTEENETNCVNCKCCLINLFGVWCSCLNQGSQLQTSFVGTLNMVSRRGRPNPVAQLIWGGTFDCNVEVMGNIPCSRCPRSWCAAGSPNLCRNVKLRIPKLHNICSSHSQLCFHRRRIDNTRGRSLAKKYPKMARFGTRFGGTWGILPRSRANHTHKLCKNELQILSSLSIRKHYFDIAVKFTTPEQLRDRVGSASPRYHFQAVHAAGLQLALLIYAGIRQSGYLN